MFGRVLRNPKLMSMPARQSAQVRRLNLHEFQSLEIMKGFGVATPQGIPADTPAEAKAAFSKIRGDRGTYLAKTINSKGKGEPNYF
ncbi:hypothetical protein DVH05_007530 [Phytophthora capsici]|nr:hypothetical protein DVH05_007530 [Phytophthora capsici]